MTWNFFYESVLNFVAVLLSFFSKYRWRSLTFQNPSFKLATLDFVRSDKSLFQLVALNFCLYAELAAMFQSDAQSLAAKLALTSDGRLVCSESNRTLLHDVIDNYTHAAQHFIQVRTVRTLSPNKKYSLRTCKFQWLSKKKKPPLV